MKRLALSAVAALSLAAVAAAYYTQHVWGMQPCPWCVLQRLIFIVIAIGAMLGLILPRAGAALAGSAAVTGVAAALWQHFVAASSASCDLTLADRVMGATGLDARWPELFMATATCAEAKVDLVGLPYEFWSLGLFVIVAVTAWRIVFSAARR